MMFMPYFFFFMSSLFLGLFISLCSSSWLYVWMGLEINLISFIPIMMSSHTMMETESALKYFMVQAFGSGLLLFGVFFYMMSCYMNIGIAPGLFIIVFSLMVKLGMVPFHFWLPHVMGGSSWMTCMMLSVVQKISPMFVLFNLMSFYNMYLALICGFGSLVGGLGGLNQSQLRFILAYSSIGHMGWMMMCSMFSYSLFIIYFLVYSLINISIMTIMNYYNLKILSMMNMNNISSFYFISLGFMFMSLAGLPPFLGFYPKMVVLSMSMSFDCMYVVFMLVLGSLMNIFYYLNIFFNLYLSSYFSEIMVSGVVYNFNFVFYSVFLGLFSTLSMGLLYCFYF
uniref:NADH dehydrogenase subunit 2 n=1 Tax=Phyllodoce medipapillata TaxID=868040 RepID=UPI0030FF274F